MTTAAPTSHPITVESHPYKLGMVVYETLDAAKQAKANARELYPEAPLPIIARSTGEVVA